MCNYYILLILSTSCSFPYSFFWAGGNSSPLSFLRSKKERGRSWYCAEGNMTLVIFGMALNKLAHRRMYWRHLPPFLFIRVAYKKQSKVYFGLYHTKVKLWYITFAKQIYHTAKPYITEADAPFNIEQNIKFPWILINNSCF